MSDIEAGIDIQTHYLGGFQYTEDHLDFFPHAEGYVNVLDFSEFHYVYTYKDHLGNIRLKYIKHTETDQTEVMEENHYYPYGLTHTGYNGEHRILRTIIGTGIDLVEVTPLAGDKHKYKFNGMEWQDELDLGHYDFGARNYDPALGRWMNIDPLAEMMRRHSPYNYAFNNPVYFIDPDGMMPGGYGGFANVDSATSTGSYESYGGSQGYDVRTFDPETGKTIDIITVNNKQGVDIHAGGKLEKNNLQTPGDGGGADVSLGGGGCPDGKNCDDPLKSYIDDAVSLEKWVQKYGTWSQEDIALEDGRDKWGLPNGPDKDWRYVINPYDGNVMDMRHVVVVGYGMGEVKGLGAEIIQKIAGWIGLDPQESAFDPQDRYSNNIGAAFHSYDFRKNGINMSLNFGGNFNEFLNKVYKK